MNIKIIRLEKKVFKLWCEKKEQYGFAAKTHSEFAVFLLETIVELSDDGAKLAVPKSTDSCTNKGEISNPEVLSEEKHFTEPVLELPKQRNNKEDDQVNPVNPYQLAIKEEPIDECETVIVMPSDETNLNDLNRVESNQQNLTSIKAPYFSQPNEPQHNLFPNPNNITHVTPTLVPYEANFHSNASSQGTLNKSKPFATLQPRNQAVTYVSIPHATPSFVSQETFTEINPTQVPVVDTYTQDQLIPTQNEPPNQMATSSNPSDNLDLMRKEFVPNSYGNPDEIEEDRSAISSIFQRLMNRGFLRYKHPPKPGTGEANPSSQLNESQNTLIESNKSSHEKGIENKIEEDENTQPHEVHQPNLSGLHARLMFREIVEIILFEL